MLDIALEKFGKLKQLRTEANIPLNTLYPAIGSPAIFDDLEGINLRVYGNPNLANVKAVMLGIKTRVGRLRAPKFGLMNYE